MVCSVTQNGAFSLCYFFFQNFVGFIVHEKIQFLFTPIRKVRLPSEDFAETGVRSTALCTIYYTKFNQIGK